MVRRRHRNLEQKLADRVIEELHDRNLRHRQQLFLPSRKFAARRGAGRLFLLDQGPLQVQGIVTLEEAHLQTIPDTTIHVAVAQHGHRGREARKFTDIYTAKGALPVRQRSNDVTQASILRVGQADGAHEVSDEQKRVAQCRRRHHFVDDQLIPFSQHASIESHVPLQLADGLIDVSAPNGQRLLGKKKLLADQEWMPFQYLRVCSQFDRVFETLIIVESLVLGEERLICRQHSRGIVGARSQALDAVFGSLGLAAE